MYFIFKSCETFSLSVVYNFYSMEKIILGHGEFCRGLKRYVGAINTHQSGQDSIGTRAGLINGLHQAGWPAWHEMHPMLHAVSMKILQLELCKFSCYLKKKKRKVWQWATKVFCGMKRQQPKASRITYTKNVSIVSMFRKIDIFADKRVSNTYKFSAQFGYNN